MLRSELLFSPCRRSHLPEDLPVVETVDREDHGFRQEARVAEGGLEQELPIVAPALPQDAQVEHRLQQGLEVDQPEALAALSA